MPPRRTSKRSSTGSASSPSTVASHITSTHPRFGQQLDRNGIVFARSRVSAPKDLDELLGHLNRRRESKSPSECEYRSYLEVVETSYNEETLTRAFDTIAKVQRHRSPATAEEHRRYVTVYNMTWTQSAACVQEGISNPKPDIIEAFTTDAYPAAAVEHLGGSLAPSNHPPAMPTFVVHTKGPNGSMDEAEKQCAYDGAVMVEAALQAHKYTSGSDSTSESAFHHQTQALTVAFNGEDVHISAHHRTPSGKYHTYPVAAEKPRFSFQKYKVAQRQLRNAQDWARRRADRTCQRLWAKTRCESSSEVIDTSARQCSSPRPLGLSPSPPPSPALAPIKVEKRRRTIDDVDDESDVEELTILKQSIELGVLTPPPSSNGRKRVRQDLTDEQLQPASELSSFSTAFEESRSSPCPPSPNQPDRFYSPRAP